jgi:putative metallohydrolase (TIGR04338 family)
MRDRDNQKARLYKAESVIRKSQSEKYAKYLDGSIPSCQEYVNAVLKTAWFSRRWMVKYVNVKSGKGARGGINGIRLGKWARCEAVILHELAHNLVPRSCPNASAHGPEFAGVFYYLVQQVMGKEEALKLKASFKENKVRMNRKAIPKPDYISNARQEAEKRKTKYQALDNTHVIILRTYFERAVNSGMFGEVGSKSRNDARKILRQLKK